MCAIFGCDLKGVKSEDLETLRSLAIQSQIRGKHAFGISYIGNKGLTTITASRSSEEFLKDFSFEECVFEGNVTLIGHCRYSTSDINYNQPLTNGVLSIVHNGVIEQSDPSTWSKFGYKLETTNDSELILRAAENKEQPLKRFPEASMAVAELRENGSLRLYRNGKRPLWKINVDNGFFFSSTRDIALRSGLNNPERCTPGVVYQGKAQTTIVEVQELIPA